MTTEKVSSLTKLYVWSIVLEPMLFFVIADRNTSGIGGNISRILQFIVLIVLLIQLIKSTGRVKVPNPFDPLYKNYIYYLILVICSGIIGAFAGAYTNRIKNDYSIEMTAIATFLNGDAIRPIFEYVITLYYFIYFVILPSYLIKSKNGLNYFFKVFIYLLLVCLILGYIDFVFSLFGHAWLPRHMLEGRSIALRFHGIAGEPRDAFVYLFYGLAILNLYQYWNNRGFAKKSWIVVISVAMLLTQSASGLLGLLFGVLLYFLFSSVRFSFISLLKTTVLFSILFAAIYLWISYSPRLQFYLEFVPDIEGALKDGVTLPTGFASQFTNIYPLWSFYNSITNLEIIKVLFGQGLGSASILNMNIVGEYELMNPNSEVVRLIFESGIIGIFLFIRAFLFPAQIILKGVNSKDRRVFIIFLLFLIGIFFGHRSSALFIYLGIFIVALKTINSQQNTNNA